jgi:hypothetical protein
MGHKQVFQAMLSTHQLLMHNNRQHVSWLQVQMASLRDLQKLQVTQLTKHPAVARTTGAA